MPADLSDLDDIFAPAQGDLSDLDDIFGKADLTDLDSIFQNATPEVPREETSLLGDGRRGFGETGKGFNDITTAASLGSRAIHQERVNQAPNPGLPGAPSWLNMGEKDRAEAARRVGEENASIAQDAEDYARHQKMVEANPQNENLRKLGASATYEEVWDNLSVGAVASSVAESAGRSLPTMPSLILGFAGALPMAMGQFVASMVTERAATASEVLLALGIQPGDKEGRIRALSDPKFAELMQKKLPKDVVISLFEGIGGFLAGKAVSNSVIKNTLAQVTVGGTAGGVGEIAGSAVIGETAAPGEVALEVLGSIGGQVPESVIAGGLKGLKAKESKADLGALEEDIATRGEALQLEDDIEASQETAEFDNDTAPMADLVDLMVEEQVTEEEADAQYDAWQKNGRWASSMGDRTDVRGTDYSQKLKAVTSTLSSKPMKAQVVIQTMIDNAPTVQYKSIAGRVQEAIKDLGIDVQVVKDKQAVKEGWVDSERGAFQYDEEGSTVYLRSSMDMNSNGLNFQTMLHEMVHAATAHKLYAVEDSGMPDKNVAELHQIIADLTQDIKRKALSGDYLPSIVEEALGGSINAIDNPHEILAWGMTNPEFQQWMREVTFSGDKRSFASRFLTAMKQLFGIKREDASTFARMLGIFDDLTATPSTETVANMTPQEMLAHKQTSAALTYTDLAVARTAFVQKMLMATGRAGKDAPTNVFEEGFNYLKKLADEKQIPLVNADDEKVVMNSLHLGAISPKTPSSPVVGPYTLIPNPGKVPVLALAIEDYDLQSQMAEQFPNYQILTMPEAEYFVRTGQTNFEAHADWRKKNAVTQSLDMIGKAVGKTSKALQDKLSGVAEFLDVPDSHVAKQEILENDDLKTNVTDLMSSGANSKGISTNNAGAKWWRKALKAGVQASQNMSSKTLNPMAKSWHKMVDADRIKVMKTMLLFDEHQVDADSALLRSHGFTDTMIELTELFYAADKQQYSLMNKNRADLGLDTVERRRGHFPGMFNDQFQSIAYRGKEIVGVIGATTRIGLGLNQDVFLEENSGVHFGEEIRKPLENSVNESVPLGVYYQNLEAVLGLDNGKVQSGEATDAKTAQNIAANFLGHGRYAKDKKGIKGNKGNKSWKSDIHNAQEQFTGMLNYLQDGSYHHAMMLNVKDLSDLANDKQIIRERPKTAKYLANQLLNITGRAPRSGLVSSGTKAAYNVGKAADSVMDLLVKRMGMPKTFITTPAAKAREAFALLTMSLGNVSFMALQVAQVPMSGTAMASALRQGLGTKFYQSRTAPVKAAAQMAKAYLATVGDDLQQSMFFKSMSPDDQLIMQFIADNDIIDSGTLEQQASVLDHETPQAKLFKAADFSRRLPEQTTRPYVFYWMLNIVQDNGVPLKQALEIAYNATQMAMIDYHSQNRPQIYNTLGEIGRNLGQLKTFAHGFVGQQAYFAKKNGKRSFMNFLAMYIAFAGVEGLFGYDELDEIVRQWNSVFNDEPDKDLRYYAQEHLPEWLRVGLMTTATGYDVYSRVRMPSLVDIENLVPPAAKFMWGAFEAGFDWAQDPKSERLKGNFYMKSLPTAGKNLYGTEKFRMKRGNLMDKDGNISLPDYTMDIPRRLGFKEKGETAAQERYMRQRDSQFRNRTTSRDLREKLDRLVTEGRINSERFKDLMKQYQKKGGDPRNVLGPQARRENKIRQDQGLKNKVLGLKHNKGREHLGTLFKNTDR